MEYESGHVELDNKQNAPQHIVAGNEATLAVEVPVETAAEAATKQSADGERLLKRAGTGSDLGGDAESKAKTQNTRKTPKPQSE